MELPPPQPHTEVIGQQPLFQDVHVGIRPGVGNIYAQQTWHDKPEWLSGVSKEDELPDPMQRLSDEQAVRNANNEYSVADELALAAGTDPTYDMNVGEELAYLGSLATDEPAPAKTTESLGSTGFTTFTADEMKAWTPPTIESPTPAVESPVETLLTPEAPASLRERIAARLFHKPVEELTELDKDPANLMVRGLMRGVGSTALGLGRGFSTARDFIRTQPEGVTRRGKVFSKLRKGIAEVQTLPSDHDPENITAAAESLNRRSEIVEVIRDINEGYRNFGRQALPAVIENAGTFAKHVRENGADLRVARLERKAALYRIKADLLARGLDVQGHEIRKTPKNLELKVNRLRRRARDTEEKIGDLDYVNATRRNGGIAVAAEVVTTA